MAQPGYFSCPGCGRMFMEEDGERDDKYGYLNHDCDYDPAFPMKKHTPAEVAASLANQFNNPAMESSFRLWAETIERGGYFIVTDDDS